ncbi:TPA: DASH family cryptochrome [Photobacterium damselae]
MKTGLYLFQNDLRLHDNLALLNATTQCDRLLLVYCLPYHQANRYPYHIHNYGALRLQFLLQSLHQLHQQLQDLEQELLVFLEHPLHILPQLISQYDIHTIISSEQVGYYENQTWQTLNQRYPYIEFKQWPTHTLLHKEQLPFDLNKLPSTFSQFRRQVEHIELTPLTPYISHLPPSPNKIAHISILDSFISHPKPSDFIGGEATAISHLTAYFKSDKASRYKETRNELDGWDYSTKFSPWLAQGCLSAKRVIYELNQYHHQVDETPSSQWIKFELLWREYFQWYAHHHQQKMFQFKGIKSSSPHTSFYPERFKRWCESNTPYPLVNALMRQLITTGYMSNRGRQIVASCFVNELELDWRYGAAFFEQHLIDYDIASNWGNWQYLAGVGADPKGNRHFNLDKQTELFDPQGQFITKWNGNNHDGKIDSVDAADWPIY